MPSQRAPQETFKTVKGNANPTPEIPSFYIDVSNLIREINEIERLRNEGLNGGGIEVNNRQRVTLTALKDSLIGAQAAFNKAGLGHHEALRNLCETSVNAIRQHQQTLIAAPGIWNQLKALINNVFEEYLSIKDALKIEQSTIATTGNFKHEFEKVKNEGRGKIDEIDREQQPPNFK